jgi:hypothetical protein
VIEHLLRHAAEAAAAFLDAVGIGQALGRDGSREQGR